ncbi:MAG: GFA family protein [Corynebacteriales bacterium]|nr:GFA family protein [Mycobacteriales bacterium]
MTEQGPHTGGCLCGNIRYEAVGPIDFPHVCSCEHCQRRSGAPVTAWVDVPIDGFRWLGPGGEPTWYYTFSDTKRGFCAICGSSVSAQDEGADTMGLAMMSLDEHRHIVPQSQSFRNDAVSWLPHVPWRP